MALYSHIEHYSKLKTPRENPTNYQINSANKNLILWKQMTVEAKRFKLKFQLVFSLLIQDSDIDFGS